MSHSELLSESCCMTSGCDLPFIMFLTYIMSSQRSKVTWTTRLRAEPASRTILLKLKSMFSQLYRLLRDQYNKTEQNPLTKRWLPCVKCQTRKISTAT